MTSIQWIPLESNPDVMNEFMYDLGVSKKWQFTDVYGLDPAFLESVPRPVVAVVFLYPLPPSKEEQPIGKAVTNEKIVLIKQTIHNACGTVAMLHAIANNADVLDFTDRSIIDDLIRKFRDATPAERGEILEKEERVSTLHDSSASKGQTEPASPSSRTNLHFICLLEVDNDLYELDGRKEAPIFHRQTSKATFLEDCCSVIKQFMARDPENLNFSVIALCGAS